jgi:hypothetical protein
MVTGDDVKVRVAVRWFLASFPKEAGWAGSGYGGTLEPSTLGPGEGARIVAAGGQLRGWDRYAQLVTEAYVAAPARSGAGVKSFRTLQNHIIRMFTRMQSKIRVEFVEQDPYQSAEQMEQEVRATGVLKIYSGHNQAEAWDRPEINLMLRAVHDFAAHLGAMGKGRARTFDLKGEYQAYNKHLNLVGCQSAAAGALFTEIIGQVSFARHTGQFPSQKIVTLPQFDWCRVGAVQGYRIVDGDLVRA